MTEKTPKLWGPEAGLSVLVMSLAVGVILYRLLYLGQLQHTALLYVGIPTVLSLILIQAPSPRSITGSILKALTLALLISGIFLGEGFVCILMAAPIILGVGLVIGLIMDSMRRSKSQVMGLVILVAGPLSLEGVVPELSFDRDEVVSVERVVDASPDQVAFALAAPMDLSEPLPWFQRLGFPTPTAAVGVGAEVQSERVVTFEAGGEVVGTMKFVVDVQEPGRVLFRPESDSTPFSGWLQWQSSEVRWSDAGDGRTRVTWTLAYRRGLDPVWYFGPLERYGVRTAAEYLIRAAATP